MEVGWRGIGSGLVLVFGRKFGLGIGVVRTGGVMGFIALVRLK